MHNLLPQVGEDERAKAFGKGVGFGVGLALLGFTFLPILGFGDAEYQGAPHTL